MTSVSSYGPPQRLMDAYKDMLVERSQTSAPTPPEVPPDRVQAFVDEMTRRFGGQAAKPPQPPLSFYEAYALGLTERETPSGAAGIYGTTQDLPPNEPETTAAPSEEISKPDRGDIPSRRDLLKAILIRDGQAIPNTGDPERWDVMAGDERVATVWSDGWVTLARTKPPEGIESSYEYHPLHDRPLPAFGGDKSLADYAQLLADRVGGTVEWSKVPPAEAPIS